MEKYEVRLKNWALNNKLLFFNSIITITAVLMRISLLQFHSGDFDGFLHPWMLAIKENGGLLALNKQIGDYNIMYQFLIALGSYLPINDLWLYKGLSVLFDFVLAIGVGMLVARLVSKNKKTHFSFAYAITLLLPTVVFDSALWAQCDSIYTAFIVFSLYFLLKEKYNLSFIFLGIAFAFKFQTIFILPFYLVLYFVNRKIYIYHYLIMVLVFWLSGLPAFLAGRSLFSPFLIYMHQTNTYQHLFMNFYNFTGLLGEKANSLEIYELLSKYFILLTVSILVVGLMIFIVKYQDNPIVLLGMATWTVYTCVMFLPSIHERYSFVVDVLFIVLLFVDKSYVMVGVLEILNSFMAYTVYLFSNDLNMVLFSYIGILTYLYFSYIYFSKLHKGLPNGIIENERIR